MAEGVLFPHVERGALLAEPARVARLRDAIPAILAAVDGETDAVALQASLARLLWDALPHANFCGFYRRVAPRVLAIGPYQGSFGCLRIDFARGVCGRCARTGELQLVDDVSAVPDHITCDAASRSELVLPVMARGDLRAVLDLDSPHLAGFSRAEAELLTGLLTRVFDRPDVVF